MTGETGTVFLFADKTVVMISHRNSTLGACSRVCRVQEGKVAGE